MNNMYEKLEELEHLIKGIMSPSLSSPNIAPAIKQTAPTGRPNGPGMPKMGIKAPKVGTGISNVSKKNPVKIAEQINNPDTKKESIKSAKEGLSFNSRGQWSLR